MSNSYIKKLPPNLINQISAGEVIERPASAIKELVENSIDAEANNIQIQILSQDGRSFRVTDNGFGILAEEIELAFTDHATSKISQIEDLNNLFTKGFRGEALASISAVSEIICLTKHKSADKATKAYFDKNGQLIKMPAAFSGGTCFEINNLFGNIPVRLKFLKRPETELQAIQDIMREIAIAHPSISFCFQIKDKTIFKTTGSGDWEQTVKEVLQEKTNFKYLEASREEEPLMNLKGLIAPISEAKSDKKAIITLLNKRPIQCQIMRKAIKAVYQGFLSNGKYPRLILDLTLPSSDIDINVHPTKKEVRYSHPNLVYQLIQNALEKHLILASTLIQKNEVEPIKQIPFTPESALKDASAFKNYEKTKPESSKIIETETKIKSEKIEEFKTQKNEKISSISALEIKKVGNQNIKSFKAERGNLSDFCLRSGDFYVSGQISGPKWLRENYLEMLSNWLFSVDLDSRNKEKQDDSLQIQVLPMLKKNHKKRRKTNLKTLEAIWQRDGWRCVYCGKHLIHPLTAKQVLRQDPESWTQRVNEHGEVIKTHLFREHQASYDHYFAFSHSPALGEQVDNLYACCRACNQAKSNSNNFQKWQIQKFEPWAQPLQIGNLTFLAGKIFSQATINL